MGHAGEHHPRGAGIGEPLPAAGVVSLGMAACVQTYRAAAHHVFDGGRLSPRHAAQALALRACRAQLYREFPDAIIEAERRSIDPGEDAAACTVTYIFCANIAEKP